MGVPVVVLGILGAAYLAKQRALCSLPPTQASTVAPATTPSCFATSQVPASTAGSSMAANEAFAVASCAPATAPGTGAASQTPTKTNYPPQPNNFAVLQAHPKVATYNWLPNTPLSGRVAPYERGNTWGGKPPKQTGLTFLNAGGLNINGVPVPGGSGGGGGAGGGGGLGGGGYGGKGGGSHGYNPN
jgi:hypothetical protein